MNVEVNADAKVRDAGDACCEAPTPIAHACAHDAKNNAPREAATPALARFAFKITGLDCAEEVEILKRAVGPIAGGEGFLRFDILNAKMTVVASSVVVDPDIVRAAVARTGMQATPWDDAPSADRAAEARKQLQSGATGASGTLLLLGFAIQFWVHWLTKSYGGGAPDPNAYWQPETAAFAVSILYASRYTVAKALYSLRSLRPDINLLMMIAVIGAVAINQWSEAATVAFLFALSVTIENWSVDRARNAVSALLDLSPSRVRVIDPGGAARDMPPALVAVGTHFLVAPGERIALDGRIIKGGSFVDQAPITGESIPVSKEPGAEVFAGTINGDGALEIESTKLANNTTLAQVARMVGEAQSKRAQSEQWVERFARYYTPAVMFMAIAVATVPPLIDGRWHSWFYSALVLLVIACPCALVISTPVSIVAALASAARRGVLIKGGLHIETPASARVVAFDKTGTLTESNPKVFAVTAFGDFTKDDVIARAACLESRSTHPLAKAILREVSARNVTVAPPDDLQALQGKGVTGSLRGEKLWLGSARLVDERGLETKELHKLGALHAQLGRTPMFLGNETQVLGVIAVADPIRANAAQTIKALKAGGVIRTVMLSGDNLATASAIGREVGVDEVHADLLPADKVKCVALLMKQYGPTIMVGDGVNDAPAMAGATLGIAMGAMGSDAAIEAADVALMSDDIAKVPWLIAHSKRTLGIIRQNIGFSLGLKLLFAGLTMFGIATLWGAVAADVGASVLVTLNGLRLLKAKPV